MYFSWHRYFWLIAAFMSFFNDFGLSLMDPGEYNYDTKHIKISTQPSYDANIAASNDAHTLICRPYKMPQLILR